MIDENLIKALISWVATVFSWLNNHYLISYKGFQLSFLAADLSLIAAVVILKLIFGSIFSDEEVDPDDDYGS